MWFGATAIGWGHLPQAEEHVRDAGAGAYTRPINTRIRTITSTRPRPPEG
jgi:hypothetical protein